jgi:hypothetical protein
MINPPLPIPGYTPNYHIVQVESEKVEEEVEELVEPQCLHHVQPCIPAWVEKLPFPMRPLHALNHKIIRIYFWGVAGVHEPEKGRRGCVIEMKDGRTLAVLEPCWKAGMMFQIWQ